MRKSFSRRTPVAATMLAMGVLAGPEGTAAQAFGVYEHSACAMGLADGAVARPCDDGSAIYYNPAGLGGSRGTSITLGLTGIRLNGSYTDGATGQTTEMDTGWEPVPHVYATLVVSDRVVVGLGAWAPYGLATKWPLDFEGRFVGYDNRLRSIYVQPTVSFRLTDDLRVGAGATVVSGNVELNRRLDLAVMTPPPGFPAPPGTTLGDLGIPAGTDFADAGLEGDADIAVGANLGVIWQAHERLSLGARYMSEVDLAFGGDVDFTPVATGITLPPGNPFGVPGGTPLDAVIGSFGLFDPPGPLADQGLNTDIAMPAQLQTGVAVRVLPALTLFADYEWIGWSSFDRVVLDFDQASTESDVQILDYEDTSVLRLAGAYALDGGVELRLGYAANEAAAPAQSVTPLLAGASRNIFSAGAGLSAARGLRLDAGLLLVRQAERPGRVRNPPTGEVPTTTLSSGTYNVDGLVLGLTARYRF